MEKNSNTLNYDRDFSRAILYGESLFVTLLATPERQLLFWETQWEKLSSTMQQIVDGWNTNAEKAILKSQLELLLPKNSYARVRFSIQLTLPSLPLLQKYQNRPADKYWISTVQVYPIEFSLQTLPVKKVKTFVKVLDPQLQLQCKVGSYGYESINFLKKNFVQSWDDYLWVNPDQTIRECATSNVFALLKNGEWITPSTQNCYNGATRQHFICWLQEKGQKITQESINLNKLSKIECLIFTNAVQIMGLIELPTLPIIEDRVKDRIQKIRSHFFLDMLTKTDGKLEL